MTHLIQIYVNCVRKLRACVCVNKIIHTLDKFTNPVAKQQNREKIKTIFRGTERDIWRKENQKIAIKRCSCSWWR